jgi:soluble lytic murein transglycosylase-like protein
MEKDPVKEAMGVVFRQGYAAGYLAGRQDNGTAAFIRGVILAFLVFLSLFFVATAHAQSVPLRAEQHKKELFRTARHVWGMNAPTSTLAAQIHQESGWNDQAVSGAGARGLSQFIDSTGRWISSRYSIPHSPFDPSWALMAQSLYMRDLLLEFDDATDPCESYAFALSAYNGGIRWTQKRRALSSVPGACLYATCDINPGILASNQRENSEYSRRILLRLEPLYIQNGWGLGRCN